MGRLAFIPRVLDNQAVNGPTSKLTEDLIASYAHIGGINHLDGENLPSKRAIALITVDLLRLLFPGYFDERIVHSSEVRTQTDALIGSVQRRLATELRKSLEYAPPADRELGDVGRVASELTVEFLRCLPRVREVLQTDVEAA